MRVSAYIRPHKLENVKTAIADFDGRGLSVNEVRGRGASEEISTMFGGQNLVIALPVRAKLSIVVPQEHVEPIIQLIIEHSRTGDSGDGKIFVEEITDIIRVRTGERGAAGL